MTTNADDRPDVDPSRDRFEDRLAQLEEIVGRMEDDSVGLEEALDLFERGMQLAKACRERLESVEQRVARLLDNDGDEITTTAFEQEEG
jgi:exodeoxyribonuclease VII small subunit